MTNLVQSNIKTMSSREIAELTGKRHDNVLQLIRKLKIDQILSPEFQETQFNGRNIPVAQLSKRDSMVLVARLSPEFTAAIVDRWQALESKEVETPEQLMARALISAQSVIEDKNRQLEEAKPAIELHNSIVNDNETLSMRDAGKRLQVKPNKFVEWLRSEKYITHANLAYQSHINSGYLVLSTTEHNGKPRTNTRVTGKGFAHFGKKIAQVKFSSPSNELFYK